jgi:hypothetical protein
MLKNVAGISFAESLSGQLTKEDSAALRLFFVSSKPLKASFTAFSETKKPGLKPGLLSWYSERELASLSPSPNEVKQKTQPLRVCIF